MRDAALRQIFQQRLPLFHWQSVETWSTGRGVPDLNYCCDGAEGWIEMKRVNGWRCRIDPEQIAWMERRIRAGGRVFLAARRREPPQTFWLFSGSAARGLASLREAQPLLSATGNPASWPWPEIAILLTGAARSK